MIEVPVYNQAGQQIETLQVDEQMLGGEVRPALLKQAYVMFHANKRQGTVANRGRGEKEGSTRKLFKQKGTGRARRGNVRTNLMRGGGVTFAKKTKDWRLSMPRKQRQLANRNALLSKLVDNEVRVVDKLHFDSPKTSLFASLLSALKIDRTVLVALDPADKNTALSARNIDDARTIRIEQLNAYDLLANRYLIVEKAALEAYLNGTLTGSNAGEKEAA